MLSYKLLLFFLSDFVQSLPHETLFLHQIEQYWLFFFFQSCRSGKGEYCDVAKGHVMFTL